MLEAPTAPLRGPAGHRYSTGTGRSQGHWACSRGRVTEGDVAYRASATASAHLVAQDGFRDCAGPLRMHGGGCQGDLWTGESQARAAVQLLWGLLLILELQLEVGNIRIPTGLEVPPPTPQTQGPPLSPTS